MATVVATSAGADGASFKFLWRGRPGVSYESGFYLYPAYDSVCVSSQAGCNVGCLFCVTGRSINRYNLAADEIVAQVTATGALRRSGLPLKVSFQGMGEPLHNYASVVAAVRDLRAAGQADMIGVSTVGFPRLIDRLRTDVPGLKLQISVHAPDDELRHRLIPGSRGTSLAAVLSAAARYGALAQGDVVFNYVLLAGINDSPRQAGRLAELARPYLPAARVKVSRYNHDPELPFAASDDATAAAFVTELRARGVPVYEFRSLGVSIASGCGQLRSRAGAS